jgi:Hypothetical glycosyl hydrolase family 15
MRRTPCALVVLFALLVPLAPPAAAAKPQAGGAGVIHPWGLQNEGGNYDVPPGRALRHARNADLMTAHVAAYADNLKAMRRANRDLVVLAYMNALFAQSYEAEAYPSEWYALDAAGERVRNAHTGNWLMVPTAEGWIENRIAECRARIEASGYDGCSLDMLGLAPLKLGYVTARPVNPETGVEYTRDEWLDANAILAGRVSDAIDAPVFGNGLSMGDLYFTHGTSRLLASLDGAMAEAWLRGSKKPPDEFPDEHRWLQDVEMVRHAQAQGKPILTLTKLWSDATPEQEDVWRGFALASYLLATDGSSYFFFSDGWDRPRVKDHPWYRTKLGKPAGEMAARDGVYAREFRKGLVLVNPGEAAVEVPLDRAYVDLDGVTLAGSVTLEPHGAAILRRAKTVRPG